MTTSDVPLTALGGWENADWFCPSVLLDDEVVGFMLPRTQGSPKQNFRLVERVAAPPPAKGKSKGAAGAAPGPAPGAVLTRRAAAGIGAVIDTVSPTHAAAFRRVTFLFEGASVLYFARIPLARLKVRAANKLRQGLVEIAHRACVLHLDGGHATAMFWPASEAAITAFVDSAAPPHPIHAAFDAALPAGAGTLGGGKGGGGRASGGGASGDAAERERARLQRTNASLLKEIAGLRVQIGQMQQTVSPLDAMEQLGLDDARLRSMLVLLHPDKHGGTAAANEAATWVNNLRDLLRGRS